MTTVRGWKLNELKSAAHEFILNDVLHLPFLLLSRLWDNTSISGLCIFFYQEELQGSMTQSKELSVLRIMIIFQMCCLISTGFRVLLSDMQNQNLWCEATQPCELRTLVKGITQFTINCLTDLADDTLIARKVHDYFLLLLCKSSIWFTEQHIFKIIAYFFNTSKCAADYVISFDVYHGFIGQKILKLWRQESWPFGPGWLVITRIRSCTFCRLCCLYII